MVRSKSDVGALRACVHEHCVHLRSPLNAELIAEHQGHPKDYADFFRAEIALDRKEVLTVNARFHESNLTHGTLCSSQFQSSTERYGAAP